MILRFTRVTTFCTSVSYINEEFLLKSLSNAILKKTAGIVLVSPSPVKIKWNLIQIPAIFYSHIYTKTITQLITILDLTQCVCQLYHKTRICYLKRKVCTRSTLSSHSNDRTWVNLKTIQKPNNNRIKLPIPASRIFRQHQFFDFGFLNVYNKKPKLKLKSLYLLLVSEAGSRK